MDLLLFCALLPTFATCARSTLNTPNFLYDASDWLYRLRHDDKSNIINRDFAHEILITSAKVPQSSCLAAILKDNVAIALVEQFDSLHYQLEIELTLTYYDGFKESNKISKKTCLDDHLVMLVFENAFTENHFETIKIWNGIDNFAWFAYKSSRDGLTKLLPTKNGEKVNTFIDEVDNSDVSDVIVGSSLLLANAESPIMIGLIKPIDSKKKTRFLNVNLIKYPQLKDYVDTYTAFIPAPNRDPKNFAHEVLITFQNHDSEHPKQNCLAVIVGENVAIALEKCLPKIPVTSASEVTLTYHDENVDDNTMIQQVPLKTTEDLIYALLIRFKYKLDILHYERVYIWNGEDTLSDYHEMFEIRNPQDPNKGYILKVENKNNFGYFSAVSGIIIPNLKEGSSLMIPSTAVLVGIFYRVDEMNKPPITTFLNINAKIYPQLNDYVGRVPKPKRLL